MAHDPTEPTDEHRAIARALVSEMARRAGTQGGRSTSSAKVAAGRENAKKARAARAAKKART